MTTKTIDAIDYDELEAGSPCPDCTWLLERDRRGELVCGCGWVDEQFAAAAADFAGGLWPPNPVQLAAGAKHLLAGAAFTAIGGGGGGRAGVGSGGGGAAPGGFTNDRPFGASRGTITIQFPGEGFIRAGDPAFQDWLAETIRRAGDRDVIVNPVGA